VWQESNSQKNTASVSCLINSKCTYYRIILK
jgi:hypothetical protein